MIGQDATGSTAKDPQGQWTCPVCGYAMRVRPQFLDRVQCPFSLELVLQEGLEEWRDAPHPAKPEVA